MQSSSPTRPKQPDDTAPPEAVDVVVRVPVVYRDAPASRWMRASASPLGREVRRLVARGEIVGARPGKYLLVDRESHDAWIARHRVQPPAAPEPAPAADDDENDLAEAFGVVRRVG